MASTARPSWRILRLMAEASFAAMSVSGLVLYPFHTHPWAAWAWVALTMVLASAFAVVLDRVR